MHQTLFMKIRFLFRKCFILILIFLLPVSAFLNPSTYALMDDSDRQGVEATLLREDFIQRMNFNSESR